MDHRSLHTNGRQCVWISGSVMDDNTFVYKLRKKQNILNLLKQSPNYKDKYSRTINKGHFDNIAIMKSDYIAELALLSS